MVSKITKNKFNKGKKNLCNENYKSLKKEIEENIKNGKIFHVDGLVESISRKWLYYQRHLYVQCNPHQNSNDIPHGD
jgi:hypothetical protein